MGVGLSYFYFYLCFYSHSLWVLAFPGQIMMTVALNAAAAVPAQVEGAWHF